MGKKKDRKKEKKKEKKTYANSQSIGVCTATFIVTVILFS